MLKLTEGYYKAIDNFYRIITCDDGKWFASVSGGNNFPLTIQYGDFGEADPKVQEMSGMKNYNMKIGLNFAKEDAQKAPDMIDLGILYDNGNKSVLKGGAGVSQLIKLTEEEYIAFLNDFDPIESPPNNYKIQPENQGKLIWITGPPGTGKSTTAQCLARDHGYVYYEADCFASLKNPYIPLDIENPSMGQMHQKILGGPGFAERKALISRTVKVWQDFANGRDYDKDLMIEYYSSLAMDISKEKKRIGGDWAVASVLMTKDVRQHLQKIFGSDLIIVSLTMSNNDRRARVLKRHQGDTTTANRMDKFEKAIEPIDDDEPNIIVVDITSSMTRDEVVDLVRKCIQK